MREHGNGLVLQPEEGLRERVGLPRTRILRMPILKAVHRTWASSQGNRDQSLDRPLRVWKHPKRQSLFHHNLELRLTSEILGSINVA